MCTLGHVLFPFEVHWLSPWLFPSPCISRKRGHPTRRALRDRICTWHTHTQFNAVLSCMLLYRPVSDWAILIYWLPSVGRFLHMGSEDSQGPLRECGPRKWKKKQGSQGLPHTQVHSHLLTARVSCCQHGLFGSRRPCWAVSGSPASWYEGCEAIWWWPDEHRLGVANV